MSARTIGLDEALHAYVVANGSTPDEVLADLVEETKREAPSHTSMQIAPEQGRFLGLLVWLTRAEHTVEIGTFTGYSSICIARALQPGGRLTCFDASEEWTRIARRYWRRAGVEDRIELRLGDAREQVADLDDTPIDFAFIDADKSGYPDYYEAVLSRLSPHGLIAVDNTLAGGRAADPDADDATATAIARFNTIVAEDTRVDAFLLPVADGVTLIRRRDAV